jgi:hypothetical protein
MHWSFAHFDLVSFQLSVRKRKHKGGALYSPEFSLRLELREMTGSSREETNRHAEGELLFRRALAIDERSFGPEQAILERTLGPENPNVAICLENYALLLLNTGRTEEAAPLESGVSAI